MKTFARIALLTLCAALAPAHALLAQDSGAKSHDSTAKSAMDYLREGSTFYIKGDFKKAIGPYQKALDLEKKERKLEKNLWRVLVDNLGMAYGITGDLKRAKDVFEYGLTQDDTYPLFYYNMACTYAEMGDEDKAIDNLKIAFKYKENIIEGEEMPDPASDDSFTRYMKDEKFLKALREIKGQ